MSTPERKHSPIRSLLSEGPWLVNDRRYFDYAHVMLKEFGNLKAEIDAAWPAPLNEAVREDRISPELIEKIRRRDFLSDSVQIFSAMSVEAFINFYGVLRLGEEEFEKNFERLGLVNKLQVLLLVCDAISISKKDPLVILLLRISTRRNTLVHPKTKELQSMDLNDGPPGDKIPDAARDAVLDMECFFKEFVLAIPGAAHHVPPQALRQA